MKSSENPLKMSSGYVQVQQKQVYSCEHVKQLTIVLQEY